jgi:hypothetical protein
MPVPFANIPVPPIPVPLIPVPPIPEPDAVYVQLPEAAHTLDAASMADKKIADIYITGLDFI